MNTGRIVFSQITDYLPLHQFHQCVHKYRGHYKVQRFSCLDQFLAMAFAQLTYRESLRDIEACLDAQKSKRYHMGIRADVSKSTLAYANETRDWRIYADFAQILIGIARALYAGDDFGLDLKETVYAFDSSIIDLCLSLFPWARFRKRKGAVKLHTLLDLRGSIPTFIGITDGKVHDVNVLERFFRRRPKSDENRSTATKMLQFLDTAFIRDLELLVVFQWVIKMAPRWHASCYY